MPSESDACVGYRYRTISGEHCFFFSGGAPWKIDSWSTDAEFVYLSHASDGAGVTFVCCNASFVKWEGNKMMTAKSRVLRCELTGADPMNVISSDPDVVTVDNEVWKAFLNGSQAPVKTL
jgi:hypothetical protein